MVSLEEVVNWIDSEVYERLVAFVSKELSLKVNHDAVPHIVLTHDVNEINFSDISIAELSEIGSDYSFVCGYVSAKLNVIAGSEDEQEGRDQEEGPDQLIAVLPYYKNFLNLYLVELYFLIHNPAGLEKYLQLIRIPGAKKFAKQLRLAFSLVVDK
ncbi:hypothetical protein [Pseudomonas sp. dw_358]|uniref:hypothetical protein n=1 Tax=Pseudomonas sp. dw_358 TaxID=2720083 RepID=UPI001BD5E05D|nr:hypothetical protein [Pseudomonas sp. dw_358]